MKSNKQTKENAGKDVKTEENTIRNVPENCENASLEKFRKARKSILNAVLKMT